MELIATPMDLGTIKEKLKALQYPDVDSFVSDVRLVFTNSHKYNLVCLPSSSEAQELLVETMRYFRRERSLQELKSQLLK